MRQLVVIVFILSLCFLLGVVSPVEATGDRNGIQENLTIYYFGTGQPDHGNVFNNSELNNMESLTGGDPEDIIRNSTFRYDLPQRGPLIWNENSSPSGKTPQTISMVPDHPDANPSKSGQSWGTPSGANGRNWGGIIDAQHTIWDIRPSVRIHKTSKVSSGEEPHIRENETTVSIDGEWVIERPLYIPKEGNITISSSHRTIRPKDYTDNTWGSYSQEKKEYNFKGRTGGVSTVEIRSHDAKNTNGSVIASKSYNWKSQRGSNAYLDGENLEYSGLNESTEYLSTKVVHKGSYQVKIDTYSCSQDPNGGLDCDWNEGDWTWLNNCDVLDRNSCWEKTSSVQWKDVTIEHLEDTEIVTFQHPDGHTSSVVKAPHPYSGYRIGNVSTQATVDDDDGFLPPWLPFGGGGGNDDDNGGNNRGGNVSDTNVTDINYVENKTNMIQTTWSVFYTRDRRYDTYTRTSTGTSSSGYGTRNPNITVQPVRNPPLKAHAYPTGNPPEPNREGNNVITPRRIRPNDLAASEPSGIEYTNAPTPPLVRDELNAVNVSKYLYQPGENVSQSKLSTSTYNSMSVNTSNGSNMIAENMETSGSVSPHGSAFVNPSNDTISNTKGYLRSVDPVYPSESVSMFGSRGRGVNPDLPIKNVYRNHTQVHIEHRRNVNDTDVKMYSLSNPREPAAVINAINTTKRFLWGSKMKITDGDFKTNAPNSFNITMNWSHPDTTGPASMTGTGEIYVEDINGNYTLPSQSYRYKKYDAPREGEKLHVTTPKTGYVHVVYKPQPWLAPNTTYARKGVETTYKLTPYTVSSPIGLAGSLISWLVDIISTILPFVLVIYMARALRDMFNRKRGSDKNR